MTDVDYDEKVELLQAEIRDLKGFIPKLVRRVKQLEEGQDKLNQRVGELEAPTPDLPEIGEEIDFDELNKLLEEPSLYDLDEPPDVLLGPCPFPPTGKMGRRKNNDA